MPERSLADIDRTLALYTRTLHTHRAHGETLSADKDTARIDELLESRLELMKASQESG